MEDHQAEIFEGKGGRFAVTRAFEPRSKLFQIENGESGKVVATTGDRAFAIKFARLLAEAPFQIKPLKDASE